MRRKFLATAAALAACFAAAPAAAQQADSKEVDVALVLAVDISYSMDYDEQRLQRQGYIEAILSKQVIDGIRQGVHGRIAVAYIEWAGVHERQVTIPWTIIDGEASARAFTALLDEKVNPIIRRRWTSVSGAIDLGVELIESSGYTAIRKVIDVSGDGPNNHGRPVEPARDEALGKGIVINGLPIVIKRAFNSQYDIRDLAPYYEDCVVGGPGSFSIAIQEPAQFIEATKNKLLREIAGLDVPPVIRASDRPKVDCMVGERMIRERWRNN